MSTPSASAGAWHLQVGTYLGAVACALALYALLRDNPNARQADATTPALEQQFRETVLQLQEEMARGEQSDEPRGSSARAWMHYQTALDMIRQKRVQPSLTACLVLANFAFGHTDLEQAEQLLTRAEAARKAEPSKVTQCLVQAAIGHMHFRHAPKTSLDAGRKYYDDALAAAAKLPAREAAFVAFSVRQERALDEFAAGDEAAGEEQLAAAEEILTGEMFTPSARARWQQGLEAAVIHAKVRGGLL